MFDYVEDTSHWESWQKDYRYGVLIIFPPGNVADTVNVLREKYDPRSFAICPAHISVSDPLRCAMTESLRTKIHLILKNLEPFTINFDGPVSSNEHAGVYCPVWPSGPIDDLKRLLHATSAFSDMKFERRSISPHMTIAEFITSKESERLVDRLGDANLNGSFVCSQLSLAIPDSHFRFEQVYLFSLGRS